MNSGFSDIYSWIEEGREGKPMSHTFEYLNDNSSIQSTNTTSSNTNDSTTITRNYYAKN